MSCCGGGSCGGPSQEPLVGAWTNMHTIGYRDDDGVDLGWEPAYLNVRQNLGNDWSDAAEVPTTEVTWEVEAESADDEPEISMAVSQWYELHWKARAYDKLVSEDPSLGHGYGYRT